MLQHQNGFRKQGKCMAPTQMVSDDPFLCLNVNDSYSYKINSVDISDQLWNVYQFDHWMNKYKWWWYILFWGRVLVLVNTYIIYKTLYKKGKVNYMTNYEFWRLVCLVNIDPTNFGGRDHMFSAVQHRGIRKKDKYTSTNIVSAHRAISKKRKYWKKNLDMEQSIVTIIIASEKAMVTKAPRVNDDVL